MNHIADNQLSETQARILALVCEEKSNAEISHELYMNKRTVEWHKNNLIRKTGSRNSIGLIKYAIKNKIIRPDF